MANYILKVIAKTEYGILGMAFDENGKELSCHISTDLDFLKHDMLYDIDFDWDKDTYEFDKSILDENPQAILNENEYVAKQHIEYVLEYEHATGYSDWVQTERYDCFDNAVDRLQYMLNRNMDYVQYINIKFYKTVKTVYDIYELKKTIIEK